MAYFELVNLSTGNLVGDYDTQDEALCDAWSVLQRDGVHALDSIALGYEGSYGRGEIIAKSDELVSMAMQASCATSITAS